LGELQDYVRQYHTTGVAWLSAPGEAPPVPSKSAALLSALAKREVVTKQSPAKPPVKPTVAKPATAAVPKTELSGKKWIIENYGQETVTLDNVEMDQVVFIYNCNQTTISITKKVNAVSMDKCTKTGLVVEAVVGNVEVIRCKSAQVQIVTACPTLVIDSTDSCQVFLSASALDVDIMTSKSSSINVCYEADGESVEKPVPEQFLTKVKDGKLSTTAVVFGE